MRRTPRYIWLEHTADIKIRVTGAHETDLYELAALALTDLIATELDGDELDLSLAVAGDSPRQRLIELLRELIVRFDVQSTLTVAAKARLVGSELSVDTRAIRFDPARHVGLREVKAITYCDLVVERDASGWFAELVFDV